MINQKGGLFVRLSQLQTDKLYQVRRARTNDACGANALNILGLSSKFIKRMSSPGRFGMDTTDATLMIKEYINELDSGKTHQERILPESRHSKGDFGWVESEPFSVPTPSRPGRITPSLRDRHCWNWNESQKRTLERWFNQNIPLGYITILGLLSHWVVIGRSANRGDLIIIESQQGGTGGKGKDTGDCGQAGVYIGFEQVMNYLENNAKWEGEPGHNYYILPKQTMFIKASEPEYKHEGEYRPNLSRILSTLSPPSGDASGSAASFKLAGATSEAMDLTGVPAFSPDQPTWAIPAGAAGAAGASGAAGAVDIISPVIVPEIFHIGPDKHQYDRFKSVIEHINNFIRDHQNNNPRRSKETIEGLLIQAKTDGDIAINNFGSVDIRDKIWPFYEQAIQNLALLRDQTGAGISIKELMKPRTKVKPGKFALKK